MQKQEIRSFYLVDKVDNHNEINRTLLEFFNNVPFNDKPMSQDYNSSANYTDSISKLDWGRAKDMSRDWVQYFLPKIERNITNMMNAVGYSSFIVPEVWFQQYRKKDRHNWHFHGGNFTAVYYVEHDENTSPKTELLEPYSLNTVAPNLYEGDLLLFPSHVIHRAPSMVFCNRKTIVSFNVDCRSLQEYLC